MTLIARYEIDGTIHHGHLQDSQLRRMEGSIFGNLTPTGDIDDVSNVRLLSPLAAPRIFGVGANYVAHIAEMKMVTPTRPMLFMKPTTAVAGPGDPVILPLEGGVVHYEAELAVVIGKSARRVSPEDAAGVILGYTCANDISERVIQKEEMDQGCLLIGKAFDTFCPLGPVIATGLDPSNLKLEARLNGETRQSSSTSDLLFSVPQLVSYLSQAISLQPGDVIITGTPSGVGQIAPGDVMEIELEGVGVLRNPVVAETKAATG
jgi:2-keto-4-pentenoate hydratase/2-oxohepta-3-ene-1,7-dioic acid hydratase in catechol pathway